VVPATGYEPVIPNKNHACMAPRQNFLELQNFPENMDVDDIVNSLDRFVVTSYIDIQVRPEKTRLVADIYQVFSVESIHIVQSLDKCLISTNKRFQSPNIKIIHIPPAFILPRNYPNSILNKKRVVVSVEETVSFRG
jgi:hypothetical protein